MDKYIISNASLLTLGQKSEFIRNGAVYVGGGTILDFGKEKDILVKYPQAPSVDAGGKLVMPGFIDAHNHLYGGFFQNLPVSSVSYKDFMDKYWWKLTSKLSSDGIYYSAIKGIVKAIKSGVTTIFNMHSSPACSEDSLYDIAEAFEELSMRGVLAYEITNRTSDDEAEKLFQNNSEFIKEYSSNPLVSGTLGLYNVNEASDTLLKKMSGYIHKSGCGLMLHVLETDSDDELSLDKYKKYTMDRLDEHNLLNSKTLLASPNYIDDYEADILLKTEANVVVTPSSAYYKGLELPPLDLYLSKNIPLAFGSDGIFSSIAGEAEFANRIYRQQAKSFTKATKEFTDIITLKSAQIANKFVTRPVGEIKLGSAADLIIVDYVPETDINKDNLYTHLMFGITPTRVESTIVNGNFVMKDFKLVGIDEEDLNDKYQEFIKELQ